MPDARRDNAGHARSSALHSRQKGWDVATTDDLVALSFAPSSVSAVTLNLPHPDPFGMGPFCRLRVQTSAPQEAGVYAWVADESACYVGKAVEGYGLIQKVRGQSLGKAALRRLQLLPALQGAKEVADACPGQRSAQRFTRGGSAR